MNIICPEQKSIICPDHKLGGFFSCCSIKLAYIVLYIKFFSKFPDYVDSSKLFRLYKEDNDNDITYNYFEHYNNINEIINKDTPIEEIFENSQYNIYSLLNHKSTYPVIKKYFSPSKSILKIIEDMENKYNILHLFRVYNLFFFPVYILAIHNLLFYLQPMDYFDQKIQFVLL
jgi:hypothetical protein